MANSTTWQGRTMRPILELLNSAGGTAHRLDIQKQLRSQWDPIDPQDLEVQSNGHERWWSYAAWGTSSLVQVGAMTKDGAGNWSITDLGRSLLDQYPNGAELRRYVAQTDREIRRMRRAQAKASAPRAWLIRGSSVREADLVPTWVAEGWCSLAASQLPEIDQEVTEDELAEAAQKAYSHLKYQERSLKVEEIASFVLRMKEGDLVLTTSGAGTFIGELGDGWEYVTSEDARSNLRRPVVWRNPDAGIDFGDLPATLQAKLRTGATLADLTAERANIDGLATPSLEEDQDGAIADVVERARHERFDLLGVSVAEKLLVSDSWLNDFVHLLNDSRQVVLYGPPGTGKTFLARRIAEHLVGTERVRLVQFHPSYTYEDFFEGYRPTGDGRSGTVSLALRPGPLRSLATEAVEHPEHAFVMIIDELNRANIAKVFGELYFLLEYRDDAVNVMYGDEPFTLPKNLYFICTMNTADRSIALLDAAMRRRFTFLELHPATEPTRSMLPEWLRQRELPAVAADLLTRVNELIDDHDAHIGPSYFMHPDQSEERLRRVFRTQIEPLLRETFYDRWSTLGSRFDFDRLWASVAASDAPAEGGGQGSPAEGEAGDAPHEQGDTSPLPPAAVAESPPTT